jgi:hypothetical protein
MLCYVMYSNCLRTLHRHLKPSFNCFLWAAVFNTRMAAIFHCCCLLLLPRQPLLLISNSIQLVVFRRRRFLQFTRGRYMRPLPPLHTHLFICCCRDGNSSSRSLNRLSPPTLLPLLRRPRAPRAQIRRSSLARSLHISLGLLRL